MSLFKTEDAKYWVSKGQEAMGKGNLDEAIKNCTKAIELDSKIADAYFNRGLAYYYKGLYDEAINDYSRVIELKPIHINLYSSKHLHSVDLFLLSLSMPL